MNTSAPSQGGMMIPNITINVQSGNRESSDYVDESDRSTRYDERLTSAPTTHYAPEYAPASYENNPAYFSADRGDTTLNQTLPPPAALYLGREAADAVMPARPPVIASPRATAEAVEKSRRLRGLPPERVPQRFYKEFP